MEPKEQTFSGTNYRSKCCGLIRQNLLVILTLVGVGVGFVVGFLVEPAQPSANALMWIGMPGELYIRMLKMMIVPLVVCSVITGTARMDPKSNGKVSGVSLLYIMVDNSIGSIIGASVCLVVKPGVGVVVSDDITVSHDVMETGDIFADLLRNIIPDNLIAACFQQVTKVNLFHTHVKAQTKYSYEMKEVVSSNGTANVTSLVREMTKKYVGAASSTNILGLIIVCSAFGVASAALKEQGEAFLAFFRSATDIIIKILRVLIWSTPVGVASLIAKTIASTGDTDDVLKTLGFYFMSVMIGLIVWGFILIPTIFFVVRRTNPFRFIWTIFPPCMIVFATGSTMIALPESFYSLEQKNGVDVRVSRFVAPLAATIGRSGSALYISASCVFIIQTLGRDIYATDIILVILLTWISALAIPSVTGASLVTVLILLTALNIPGEAAAMLFALEFFLDRSRSVVNLIDQLTCAMVTDKLSATSLPHQLVNTNGDPFSEKQCASSLKEQSKDAVDKQHIPGGYVGDATNSCATSGL